MSEWLYVVQTPEAIKTDPKVFKIGKTTQGPRQRFGGYPKGSTLHFQTSVVDAGEAERRVLATLKAHPGFEQVLSMGREYFRGDLTALKSTILDCAPSPSSGADLPLRVTTNPADEFVRLRLLPEGFGDSRTPLFRACGSRKGRQEKGLGAAYDVFTEWCLQGGFRRPNYTVFEASIKKVWEGAVLVYDADPAEEGPRRRGESWSLRNFTYAFTSPLDSEDPRKGVDKPTAKEICNHWAFFGCSGVPPTDAYPRYGWEFRFTLHLRPRTRVPADAELWRSLIVIRKTIEESPRLTATRVIGGEDGHVEQFFATIGGSGSPYVKESTTDRMIYGPSKVPLGRSVLIQELYEDYGEFCEARSLKRFSFSFFKKAFKKEFAASYFGGGCVEDLRWKLDSAPPSPTYDLLENEVTLTNLIAEVRETSDAGVLVVPEEMDLATLTDGYVGRGVPSVWREGSCRLRELHLVGGVLRWC